MNVKSSRGDDDRKKRSRLLISASPMKDLERKKPQECRKGGVGNYHPGFILSSCRS